LYPDVRQRTVLGWQIRWVAGLFVLLMLAAGAVPSSAADRSETLLDAPNGALSAGDDDDCATSGELCPATGELLGSTTTSDPEIEDEPDSSVSPGLPRVLLVLVTGSAVGTDVRSPIGIDSWGRTGPRAPPFA
jgi:hypothetical protein